MEKYFIHLQGTGQKNGVVVIDKKFEINYNDIGKYTSGTTRDEYIQRALDFHYPGLTSHNVTWAKVITEKVKVPKNPDAFEKFIAGAATGFVTAKATNEKKENKKSTSPSGEYSFVKEIKKFSEISFVTYDENEIKTSLDKIYNEIIDYKWKSTAQDEKENKIIAENNRALNMCLRNYASGVRQLKAVSEDEETVKYYEKQLKKLKKKRFFNKYGVIVFAILALVIIILLMIAIS